MPDSSSSDDKKTGAKDSKDIAKDVREKQQAGAIKNQFIPKPASFDAMVNAKPGDEIMTQLDAHNTVAAKMFSNPLVPIGALATTGALLFGIRAMLRGDSKTQQIMMRYRIGFQGLTVLALLGGTLYATLKQTGWGKEDKHTKPR